MKKSTYLFQESQHAALKCGAAVAILVASVAWGAFCALCQSGLGVTACWVVALVSIFLAVRWGSYSTDCINRGNDARKDGR
jgi:uncharacterized membrane protein